VAAERGTVIAAAWSGKVKTCATMVCICFMLVFNLPWLNILCQAVILGTTLYSGVEYFLKNKAAFQA
jgi:CDP-diacylglycerol--glycerol-3-phosphate 3-phosphatidyltransferase